MSNKSQAAAHMQQASSLAAKGRHAEAGGHYHAAYKLVAPEFPKLLWDAARSYEKGSLDPNTNLPARKTMAGVAKDLFIQWQHTNPPNRDDADLHIKGLAKHIDKLDAASPKGLSVEYAVVIGVVVVGGLWWFMGRKKKR